MNEIINIDTEVSRRSLFDSRLDLLRNTGSVEIKNNLTETDKAGYAKAARGFESIFVNMMLKEMKNAMLEKKEEEFAFGAETLTEYGDLMMSDEISNTGKGIGLAEMIYKQLTGDELNYITKENPVEGYIKMNVKNKISNDNLNINEYFLEHLNLENKTSNVITDRIGQYDLIIEDASNKYNVPETLIKAIIYVESAGNVNATSKAGAKGLMQLMDATALDLGVTNSYNPIENIYAGANYISQMLVRYEGNLELALAAYNAGPGNVDKYNGVPPFVETQSYIKRVNKIMNE